MVQSCNVVSYFVAFFSNFETLQLTLLTCNETHHLCPQCELGQLAPAVLLGFPQMSIKINLESCKAGLLANNSADNLHVFFCKPLCQNLLKNTCLFAKELQVYSCLSHYVTIMNSCINKYSLCNGQRCRQDLKKSIELS